MTQSVHPQRRPGRPSREQQIRRVLLLVLGYNLTVLGLKVAVGMLTGSLSVLADALHSITDSANNILGLLVTRWAKPGPDREHPYGHLKFEAMGALGIATLLGMTCLEILQRAWGRLTQVEPPIAVYGPELLLLILALGLNVGTCWYERRRGQALDSPVLLADAADTLGDIWINLAVLISLAGVWAGFPWLDTLLAVPVALLVFNSGWRVVQTNLPWLVDTMAIAPEAIRHEVEQVAVGLNCHNIASRGVVGRQVFIEMHLVVNTSSLEEAHALTEAIEIRLQERFGPARITIHMEPEGYQSDDLTYTS